MTLQRHLGPTVPLSLVLLFACGPSGPTGIDDPRELTERRPKPVSEFNHAQRFGIESSSSSGARVVPTLNLPPGWQELEPSQFRNLNFRPAGDPELECFLTALGGDGGGQLANVNRWRGQMGLEAIHAIDLGELERMNFLGVPSVFVDLEGSFTGMGGAPKEGWRMLGLLATIPGQAVSLKLTGPSEKVGAQVENFRTLAAEITRTQRGSRSDPRSSSVEGAAAQSPSAGGGASSSSGGLSWETPESWAQGPARTMRLASFVPKASPGIDISVTQLAGNGGGHKANFDRWRGQMGQEPISQAELSDLERLEVLGEEALVIEIDGRFTGMGNADLQGARMLGAMVPNGNGTLFVKLTGPREAVEAEADAFRAFLTSLRRDS